MINANEAREMTRAHRRNPEIDNLEKILNELTRSEVMSIISQLIKESASRGAYYTEIKIGDKRLTTINCDINTLKESTELVVGAVSTVLRELGFSVYRLDSYRSRFVYTVLRVYWSET